MAHRLDLVAVNHLEAHALTVGLTEGLRPPYLLLLVSGGHTQLLIVHGVGRYERLGTTIDDALGEAFDKTAKLLGLGFPGGPAVEKAAAAGKAGRFTLPRPMLGRSEAHFSFAGLKTAVRHQAQALAPLRDEDIADLCAEFEKAVADSVADRVRRAMDIAGDRLPEGARHLVVAGGVAANKALRAALTDVAGTGRLCFARAAAGAVHRQCRDGRLGRRGTMAARADRRPRFRSPRPLAARSCRHPRARRRQAGRQGLRSAW